jgi:hypothetical protein
MAFVVDLEMRETLGSTPFIIIVIIGKVNVW